MKSKRGKISPLIHVSDCLVRRQVIELFCELFTCAELVNYVRLIFEKTRIPDCYIINIKTYCRKVSKLLTSSAKKLCSNALQDRLGDIRYNECLLPMDNITLLLKILMDNVWVYPYVELKELLQYIRKVNRSIKRALKGTFFRLPYSMQTK